MPIYFRHKPHKQEFIAFVTLFYSLALWNFDVLACKTALFRDDCK